MSSFARSSHTLADHFKDSTSSAFSDFGAQAMRLLGTARDQEANMVDYTLGRLGLQRRQSALRPLMFFTAGAIVASGVAVYFAPTIGGRFRDRVNQLLGMAKDKEKALEKRIDSVLTETKSTLQSERARIPSSQSHS